MIRLLLIWPEAEHDLAAARDWYDHKRPGLGDDFLNEVASALDGLPRHTGEARFYFRDFRRALLKRFPYKIFYQLIGDRVVVFRVLHAKQDHERDLADQ